MNNYLLAFLIIIISLNTSCSNNQLQTTYVQEIDTSAVKNSALKKIKSYINKHKNNNVFIINSTYLYKADGTDGVFDGRITNEIMQLSCASQYSIGKGEFSISQHYPAKYFKIEDKYVFISSEEDALLEQDKVKQFFEKVASKEQVPRESCYIIIHYMTDRCTVIDNPYKDDNIIRMFPPKIRQIESNICFPEH